MLSTWRHSGFNVFCGIRISHSDDTAMENLARYIIRASFTQKRMQYLEQAGNDDAVPCILEAQGDEKTFRRNWHD